jgi:hypothetical protein
MLRAIDQYFLKQPEPHKSCLQALRSMILASDPRMQEAWKYGMPFYCIGKKMCCYLWMHRKYAQPYIGFVEGAQLQHPELLQEKRARMKILLVDSNKDLPLKKIKGLLKTMIGLYPS